MKIPKLKIPAKTLKRILALQLCRDTAKARLLSEKDEMNKRLHREEWITDKEITRFVDEMYVDLVTEELLKLDLTGFQPEIFEKYES